MIAISSAVVAAFAFAVIGAHTSGCIAIAGWFAGLTLSLCSCFVGNWILPGLSVVALPLSLVLACGIGLLRASLPPGLGMHADRMPPRNGKGEGHA